MDATRPFMCFKSINHVFPQFVTVHCKRGIVIACNWQFVISDSDEWTKFITMLRRTTFSSFSANFPPHNHTIWAINCVYASNWFTHICNQHDKLIVNLMTICSYCVVKAQKRNLLPCNIRYVTLWSPFTSTIKQIVHYTSFALALSSIWTPAIPTCKHSLRCTCMFSATNFCVCWNDSLCPYGTLIVTPDRMHDSSYDIIFRDRSHLLKSQHL